MYCSTVSCGFLPPPPHTKVTNNYVHSNSGYSYYVPTRAGPCTNGRSAEKLTRTRLVTIRQGKCYRTFSLLSLFSQAPYFKAIHAYKVPVKYPTQGRQILEIQQYWEPYYYVVMISPQHFHVCTTYVCMTTSYHHYHDDYQTTWFGCFQALTPLPNWVHFTAVKISPRSQTTLQTITLPAVT